MNLFFLVLRFDKHEFPAFGGLHLQTGDYQSEKINKFDFLHKAKLLNPRFCLKAESINSMKFTNGVQNFIKN